MKNLGEDSRVARQDTSSPDDQRITKLVLDLLSTPWTKEIASLIKRRMDTFFDFAFAKIDSPKEINKFYKETISELNKATKSHIASGKESLEKLREAKGIIVATNHFGLYKATMVENPDNKYPVKLGRISPFPVRMIALQTLSRELGAPIFETAVELPQPLLEIQGSCDGITIPLEGSGRTEKLTDNVREISKKKFALFVMYPEGGTSGKRNGGGPYDLDEFHSGTFVVAAKLGLPILPVCQFLDPNEGMELHILPPFFLEESNLDNIKETTKKTRDLMQKKLSQLQSK